MAKLDIPKLLSTPRELCETCYNWCSQEDVGPHDWPQCVNSGDYDCYNYLMHYTNDCPKHLEL